MNTRTELTFVLDSAAREINRPRDLSSTLETIAQTAKKSLPEIDHVGISIAHKGGRLETMAATDQLVLALDELQYELGEGPCLHAITSESEPLVRVDDARHDQRWPNFIPRAVKLGLRAQLGIRLYVEDLTLGGLNLYSVHRDTISDDTLQLAELFATHAALALGRIRKEEAYLNAISSRTVIGQATGIVMERYQMDSERAFTYLVRVSQTSNTKLREVAREVVDQGSLRSTPAPEPGQPTPVG